MDIKKISYDEVISEIERSGFYDNLKYDNNYLFICNSEHLSKKATESEIIFNENDLKLNNQLFIFYNKIVNYNSIKVYKRISSKKLMEIIEHINKIYEQEKILVSLIEKDDETCHDMKSEKDLIADNAEFLERMKMNKFKTVLDENYIDYLWWRNICGLK